MKESEAKANQIKFENKALDKKWEQTRRFPQQRLVNTNYSKERQHSILDKLSRK